MGRSGKRRRGAQRARARRNNPTTSAALVAASNAVVETFEIRGQLGSHALEALRLELQQLARRCGFEVTAIRIETDGTRHSG